MNVTSTYAKKVWDRDHSCVTWHPDRVISVGDLLIRSADTTRRDTAIDQVYTGTVPTPVTRSGPDHLILSNGASIHASGHASAPVAQGKIKLDGHGDFLLVGEGGKTTEYPDYSMIRTIANAIDQEGNWKPGWFLVTSVRRFAKLTLLLADGTGGEISLSGAPPQGLGALHAGFSFGTEQGGATKYDLTDCTPLFECMKRQKTLVRKTPKFDANHLLETRSSPFDHMYEEHYEMAAGTPFDLGLIDDEPSANR
jgi:hypothetical protein